MHRIRATRKILLFAVLSLFTLFYSIDPGICEGVSAGAVVKGAGSLEKERVPDENGRHMLRFAVHVSGMGKMDPHFAVGSQDRAFADMVFNGLLRYKPGHAPVIEPDLAAGMPELGNENGQQVWTIQLRKGVLFHPGSQTESYELTADDVVYSFNKAADEKRSAYSSDYEYMKVVKTGRYTVKFIMQKPLSSILFFPKITNYNGGFIVSKKAMEALGDEGFRKHPVGTGPFMYKSHQPEKELTLVAHDDYFKGKPALAGVKLIFMPDNPVRKKGLIDGTLDVIIGSGKKGFARDLLKYKGIKMDIHGVGEVTTLYLNTRISPMDDIRVRKAVRFALERDAFLDVYNEGLAGIVHSPVPVQFLPGGMTEKEVEMIGIRQERDIEKAKALLAEAGYPDGFTLELVSSEKRSFKAFYRTLTQQLAAIGIVCNVKILPHSEMHRQIRKNPRPLVIYTAWRPNADVFLSRFFHSNAVLLTGVKPDTNFSHYTGVDKLIEDARHEVNPQVQVGLWHQAQIRILCDAAAVPLIYANMRDFRRDYVDYGHTVVSTMALYPQITEKTRILVSSK